MRPTADEIPAPHARYVEKVPEDDILSAMEQQSSETQKLLATLDDARAAYRYAEGKWSIREVFGHIADAERVFVYRALAFARGEQKALPGFDENEYASNAGYDAWKIGDLAEQYALVRRSSILFFRNLAAEAWDRRGTASERTVSVRALAYVIVGHERHHVQILHDRYKV